MTCLTPRHEIWRSAAAASCTRCAIQLGDIPDTAEMAEMYYAEARALGGDELLGMKEKLERRLAAHLAGKPKIAGFSRAGD